MLNRKTQKSAFTIIELMAVMFVISIGMVGVNNVISQTFSRGRFITEKLTAAYLAQEGIEIVRNIRDSNWLEDPVPAWDDGIPIGNWEADYLTRNLTQSFTGNGTNLKIDNDGFYGYSGTSQTKFRRKIEITKPSTEIVVAVTVYWDNYQVKAMEKLYNWR